MANLSRRRDLDPEIRTFLAGDVLKGTEPAVVVSHSHWRDRFGGDPGLVGRRIVLDSVPRTVVGILPAGFSYPAGIEVWTPLDVQRDPHTSFTGPVIGRLAIGVTQAQARLRSRRSCSTRATAARRQARSRRCGL